MPTILERLARRRHYPVPINDETFYVRSLTLGECDDVDKLPDDLKTPYAIGCALTDEGGNQPLPRTKKEDGSEPSTAEYAQNILDALQIVPPDALVKLTEAIWKVTKAAPVEDLVKN